MAAHHKCGCTTSKLLQNWKQFTTLMLWLLLFLRCTTSKLLQNWKQFTTRSHGRSWCFELYNIKVITELKAIHNSDSVFVITAVVVQHQSYYRIESNSQHFSSGGSPGLSCTTSKLLQNWKQFTTWFFTLCLGSVLYNIKVITELKAIHNSEQTASLWYRVVQHQSYYRIESNSQRSSRKWQDG